MHSRARRSTSSGVKPFWLSPVCSLYHSNVPKGSRASCGLHSTSKGILASAHGLTHETRCRLWRSASVRAINLKVAVRESDPSTTAATVHSVIKDMAKIGKRRKMCLPQKGGSEPIKDLEESLFYTVATHEKVLGCRWRGELKVRH